MLAVLLAWNIVLTIRLYNYTTVGTDNHTVIQNVVSSYSTDVTKVVDIVKTSIVGVEQGGRSCSGVVIAVEEQTIYIMTTSVGIQMSSPVQIRFDNGIEVSGSVLGEDSDTGLALLTTQTEFTVNPITTGDSSFASVGETIVAIGGRNDMDKATVGSGILSSVMQMPINAESHWVASLLEADIAENDGLIGGAFVNLSGELLGVTIVRPIEGHAEQLYAIGVNEMRNVFLQLKTSASVTRGSLGVTGRNVSKMASYEKSAYGINLDLTSGVLITSVLQDSSADGNLFENDVIKRVDDKVLMSVEELHTILFSHASGDEVVLTVMRDGEDRQVSVVLK